MDNVTIYDVKHLENSWVLLNKSVKTRYDLKKGLQAQYDKNQVSEDIAAAIIRKYFCEIFNLD